MDQAVKTIVSLIITFVATLLLITCISFFLLASNARSALYSVIDYVETYGVNEDKIEEYADKSNTQINILEVGEGTDTRYQVTVSFRHLFAIIHFDKQVSFTATTKVVNH